MMKKLLYCILMLITGFTIVSCSDDAWGSEGESDKQHWYFFGFEQWHKKPNDIKKDVNQGETLVIPMHFWSERPQNGVHAEVEYFIVTSLQLGVDFQIVNESGTVIAPETDGGYKMVWPNCEKGTQNVYLKALQGAKGKITLQTWNPTRSGDDNISTTNTILIDHGDYKVSAFTQNYKMEINIK